MIESTRNDGGSVRRTTLYRLIDTELTQVSMREALADYYADNPAFTVQFATVGDVPAVVIWGSAGKKARADWCSMVEDLTGSRVSVGNVSAAGMVIVAVEGGPFALSYGMGHLLVEAARIDPGFGLSFAIRAIEPDYVRQVTRNILDSRARVDRSTVPGGQSIRGFGIEYYGEIVSRLAGTLASVSMTFNSAKPRKVTVAAADSLKIPLGVQPSDLLRDLREIARISDTESPVPELGFIDQVKALKPQNKKVSALEERLVAALGAAESGPMALTLPAECEEQESSANSYRVKIAAAHYDVVEELAIGDIVQRIAHLSDVEKLGALKSGYIQLCSDGIGQDKASRQVSAHKWLAFEAGLDAGHYFYHQGRWFEVGDNYLEFLRERVDELFARPSSIDLPKWEPEWAEEEDYNEEAAELIPGQSVWIVGRSTLRSTRGE